MYNISIKDFETVKNCGYINDINWEIISYMQKLSELYYRISKKIKFIFYTTLSSLSSNFLENFKNSEKYLINKKSCDSK